MKKTTREAADASVSDGLRISKSLPRNSGCSFVPHRGRDVEALLLLPWERKSVGRK